MSEILQTAKYNKISGFRYYKRSMDEFYKDVDVCLRKLNEIHDTVNADELDFWVRTLSRSLTAYVDGMIAVMMDIARWSYERGELDVSQYALTDLTSDQRTSRVGAAVYPENRSIEEQLERSLSYFLMVFPCDFPLDLGESYTHFQKCLRYREMISHPDKLEDIIINFGDFESIAEGAVWFHTMLTQLQKSIGG